MASAVANLARTTPGNERFNAEAAAWDSRPFVHEASRAAADAILRRWSGHADSLKDKQILEIGCGTGILSFLLEPHFRRVVAVDAADGMIEVLRQKIATSRTFVNILPLALLLEDPEDPALPPAGDIESAHRRQKFDLITSHLVLHHIPDLRAVLHTMLACLEDGGCVMLTDFEDFGPGARRFHPKSKMGGVAKHGINAAEMQSLMREVGFESVEVKAEFVMTKTAEKFEGEFGESGKAEKGMGEEAEFPFVLCFGVKPRMG